MALRRPPTKDEIARRAWEIYQQRGHGEADAVRDWWEAKAELEAAEVAAEVHDPELVPVAGAPDEAEIIPPGDDEQE